MSILKLFLAGLCVLAVLATFAPTEILADGPGLGQPLDKDEIPVYARYVLPDGTGLPPGSGTAKAGEPIYQAQCGSCHGELYIDWREGIHGTNRPAGTGLMQPRCLTRSGAPCPSVHPNP